MNVRENGNEEARRAVLAVLKNMREGEHLIWAHRGFPNFGESPCLMELEYQGGVPYVYFTRLDTLERYPLTTYKHIITDGISQKESEEGTISYEVEKIPIGTNNPITTNFYRITKDNLKRYLSLREDALSDTLSETIERYQKALGELSTFRRRSRDFREEKGL